MAERPTRAGPARWRTALAIVLPLLLVGGGLFLLIGLRGEIETTLARVATLLPVGYAFAAGMVASVNPCGILMLPSYAFFQLGSAEAGGSTARRLLRGLLVGAVATAGFVTIFALVGGAVSAGGRWLVGVFPYAGLAIGVAMAGLGGWLLLSHRTLGIAAASRVTVQPRRTMGNVLLFGIAYAIGSLSCTLPIFLVVVGSALASEGWWVSFSQFLGYALGMGTVLVFVTIGTALFREAMSRWLRRLTPYVHRVSALFLVGAGAYLIYYWVTALAA